MTKNLKLNNAINVARALDALKLLLTRVNPNEQQAVMKMIERVEAAARGDEK